MCTPLQHTPLHGFINCLVWSMRPLWTAHSTCEGHADTSSRETTYARAEIVPRSPAHQPHTITVVNTSWLRLNDRTAPFFKTRHLPYLQRCQWIQRDNSSLLQSITSLSITKHEPKHTVASRYQFHRTRSFHVYITKRYQHTLTLPYTSHVKPPASN